MLVLLVIVCLKGANVAFHMSLHVSNLSEAPVAVRAFERSCSGVYPQMVEHVSFFTKFERALAAMKHLSDPIGSWINGPHHKVALTCLLHSLLVCKMP